jgi:hypothetical protein
MKAFIIQQATIVLNPNASKDMESYNQGFSDVIAVDTGSSF